MKKLKKTYDIAIVLTGGLINNENETEISMGRQSDRIWKALQLYRLGKTKKILIAGGEWRNGYLNELGTENEKAKLFLIENGVNPKDIFQEQKSRNTHENAKYSKEYLEKISSYPKVLLITSDFHIKRASLCFKKIRVEHDIFPVNIKYKQNINISIDSFIPNTKTLDDTDTLLKECYGLLAYKIMGYI